MSAGVLLGIQLADPGDPTLDPSPTPLATPSPTPTPVSPSPTPATPPSPSPSPSPELEAPTVEPAVLSSTTPPEDGRPAVEIDVEYPQLVGLADTGVQDRVNQAVTSAIESEVDEFLATTEETSSDNTPPYSIWSDTTVGAVDPTVMSTLVPVTTYQGGAHPYTVVRTFTFDLSSGEQVELTDLFGDGILERVSEIAIAAIQEEYGTGDWAAEGAAPTNQALGRFVLTADHLQIWFDNYQVGPYAIGTPSVDIPYDELADLIPPDGIVAGLAAG